jgi:hypothetical protein
MVNPISIYTNLYTIYPDEPSLAVECDRCKAQIGKPCTGTLRKRKLRHVHLIRFRELHRLELARRRKVRELYLAKWLQAFGDIFEESI